MTTQTSRRTFIIHSVVAAGSLGTAQLLQAQTLVMVKDEDTQSITLGYKTDGTKTDTKRFPKYTSNQNCSNCSLYQGKATDKAAACALFAGKQVAGKGWCSAWVKKAA